MAWRSMIFLYAPRQTGLAGRVWSAESEFYEAAGARAVPSKKRVKRNFAQHHFGAADHLDSRRNACFSSSITRSFIRGRVGNRSSPNVPRSATVGPTLFFVSGRRIPGLVLESLALQDRQAWILREARLDVAESAAPERGSASGDDRVGVRAMDAEPGRRGRQWLFRSAGIFSSSR